MNYQDYADYLSSERNMSENTKKAYIRDIRNFEVFINDRGTYKPEEVTTTELLAYLMKLRAQDMSKATLNRKLASLRAFYHYLQKTGYNLNPWYHFSSSVPRRTDLTMYRCIPRYIPAITGVPVAALQPCCSVRHSGAMFDMSSTLPLSNRQFSVDVLPYLLFPSQCFRKTVFLFMTKW